jgi:uncharacterized protein YkwD
MTVRRVLTVTVIAGACLLGSALPAQAAAPGPWKSTANRGTNASAPTSMAAAPVAGPVAPAAPAAPAATVVDPAAAMAAQIANIVNNERAAVGLAPLKISGCARTFAVTWSAHMAATGDFSHQSLTPLMTSCGARGAGENIAYGATSADQFMDLWMNSAGHKANILRASFTHLGVGVVKASNGRWYATQDFLTA